MFYIQNRNTIKQNSEKNHVPRIENANIVLDLDWPSNPYNNFMLKSCLFGATNIIKNSANSKHILSGHGIIFDGTREWSFDDDFAKNVDDIDDRVGVAQKKF